MFELFQPDTRIFFSYTGIDDYNKTVHASTADFVAFARGRMKGTMMEDCSFQRLDENYEIRVPKSNIQYEELLYCDTVVIYNGGPGGFNQYIGIIDNIVWKNPGCYYVYFHLDWYTTMLGNVDYENTWAYIEREHVVKDWNGSNPEFSNMGVDEGFGTSPDTPINTENKPFSFDNQQVMIYSPYGDDCKPNFQGQMQDGLYTAMIQRIMGVDEANQYLQKIAESDEADLGNIASIVSVPQEFTSGKQQLQWTFQMPWLKHVPSVPNFNNAKCWSGEFCQIKMKSGTGQSVSVNPQWFGSNKSQFKVDVNIFFNNGDGGCTASFFNENQSYLKEAYDDFSVSLLGLPQSPWVGNAYAQWKSANMLGFVLQNVGAAIGIGATAYNTVAAPMSVDSLKKGGLAYRKHAEVGAIAQAAGSGIAQAGTIVRTIGNARTSGTILGGSQNADINTACALGKYGFQIIYYMCQQYIMKSVDDYFDRFGYKVNQLKLINRKARPKWTYIKTHEVHLNSDTGFNMQARNYIQGILNTGVTFWMDPTKIGDYSSPEGNKG